MRAIAFDFQRALSLGGDNALNYLTVHILMPEWSFVKIYLLLTVHIFSVNARVNMLGLSHESTTSIIITDAT
jgi:hypothetical protein